MVEGVADEIGTGRQPQLLQDVAAVRFDRPNAQMETPPDRLIRVSECDQAQHLPLPIAEGAVEPVDLARDEAGGDEAVHVRPARGRAAQRLGQLPLRSRLDDEPLRAFGERLPDEVRVVVRRQHDHACPVRPQPRYQHEARAVPVGTEQRDVRAERPRDAQCTRVGVDIGDHLEVAAVGEQPPDPLSHQRLIVHDEDRQPAGDRFVSGGHGVGSTRRRGVVIGCRRMSTRETTTEGMNRAHDLASEAAIRAQALAGADPLRDAATVVAPILAYVRSLVGADHVVLSARDDADDTIRIVAFDGLLTHHDVISTSVKFRWADFDPRGGAASTGEPEISVLTRDGDATPAHIRVYLERIGAATEIWQPLTGVAGFLFVLETYWIAPDARIDEPVLDALRRLQPVLSGSIAGGWHAATSAASAERLTRRAERLRALVAAGVEIGSQTTVEATLACAARKLSELTDGRYAAIGVFDPHSRMLDNFVTHGLDDLTAAAIGDDPQGRGLLGALGSSRVPIRLARIADDPRSVGFPQHHPPMTSFLGVPMLVRGAIFGSLYVTDKRGGDAFDDDDEIVGTLLAATTAQAVENARLMNASRAWTAALESLELASERFISERDASAILVLLAAEAVALVSADTATVDVVDDDGNLSLDAAHGRHAQEARQVAAPRPASSDRRIVRSHPERVDSLLDDPAADQARARAVGATSALVVPIELDGTPAGLLTIYDRRDPEHPHDTRFSDRDLRLADELVARAESALTLTRRVRVEAVRGLVEAEDRERARMARELHDETSQALTAILLGLSEIARTTGDDPVEPLRAVVRDALDGVRRIAVDLRPHVLDEIGLPAAIERLAARYRSDGGPDVVVDVPSSLPLDADAESALYRVAQEAVANAVRHGTPRTIRITLAEHEPRSVSLAVADDGRGFDPETAPSGRLGLLGMRERIGLVGGSLTVSSRPGEGTTVLARVDRATR